MDNHEYDAIIERALISSWAATHHVSYDEAKMEWESKNVNGNPKVHPEYKKWMRKGFVAGLNTVREALGK